MGEKIMGSDPWEEAARAGAEGGGFLSATVVTPARGVPVVPAPVPAPVPAAEQVAPMTEGSGMVAEVVEESASPARKGKRRRRRAEPAADPIELDVEPVDEQAGPARTARWTGGNAIASKLVSALITVGLVTGPAGLALGVLSGARELVPPTVEAEPVRWDESSLAGERARELVTAWLAASRTDAQRLESLYGSPVSGLPQAGREAQDVAVAQVTSAGSGLWSVLVGADVRVAAPTEQDPAATAWSRQFFQVPVAVAQTDAGLGVQVLGLPAPVPAPVIAAGARMDYRDRMATSGTVAASVTGFLTALVAGQGDLSRYMTPGSTLTPITPVPYAGVELKELMAVRNDIDQDAPDQGARIPVRALVSLTLPDGQKTTATYALTLTARDGKWEVSSLDDTPVVSGVNAPAPQEPPADLPGKKVKPTADATDGGNA